MTPTTTMILPRRRSSRYSSSIESPFVASRLPAGARGDECAEGRVGVVRRCRLSTRTVAPRRVAGRCPGRPTRDTPSVPPSGASSDRRVVQSSNGCSDSCGRPVVDWVGARLPPRRPVRADGRPAPGHRPADRRPFARAPQPDAPGRHGHGQDVHDGQRHRRATTSRRWSWPTTRRSPRSSTRSSASSSRTTRSSTSSATSTTTSPRPTCRGRTRTSRRTRRGTTRSTGCATPRPTRCSSGAT